MAALYPGTGEAHHWWFRFSLMMSLSMVVALMGLSENSAAVVIGAMLIAPLMTPVLGMGAAVAMAWGRRLRHSLSATAVGTVGGVALAWALTMMLPSSDRALTGEVLARTSPDLRDLFIGLAAGGAGAYATSREDVSSALPGVAVAVALVPPLATVGFTLAVGRTDLAGGALLLYLTNLAAIVLAATVVFLVTGFVPAGRRRAPGIRFGLVALVVGLAAVAVPLTARTLGAVEHAGTTRQVTQAALAWLSAEPGLQLGAVEISGAKVAVEVIGPQAPPASPALVAALQGILGPQSAVQVRWFQTGTSSDASRSPSSAPLTESKLRPLVQAWLASAPGGPNGTHVTDISVSGDNVTVALTGPTPPPSASSLASLMSTTLARTVQVSVDWRAPPTSSTTVPDATSTTS